MSWLAISPAFFVVVQTPDPFPLTIDDQKGGGYERSAGKISRFAAQYPYATRRMIVNGLGILMAEAYRSFFYEKNQRENGRKGCCYEQSKFKSHS